MKSLFQNHSYDMVKMFLNQIATAIFGFSLALAAGKAQNVMLRNVTSVCAILFYLFLLYTMMWEIGFRDRAGVMNQKKKRTPFKGALLSLCANIPNFILALFITLGTLIQNEFFGRIGVFCKSAAIFLEGMYTGLLANRVGGVSLNSLWYMYFVITLPAMLICFLAYLFGLNDTKFTSVFNRQQYPDSDRDIKQKKDQNDAS